MFPIATFYFGHFLFYVGLTVIIVHTHLWTKSNVRTNIKYTGYVNSFYHICGNLF